MGFDTEIGSTCIRYKGRIIKHVQKHQDVDMTYVYCDAQSGQEFDVRELPEEYLGKDRGAVLEGLFLAHKEVIRRAIDADYDFKPKTKSLKI